MSALASVSYIMANREYAEETLPQLGLSMPLADYAVKLGHAWRDNEAIPPPPPGIDELSERAKLLLGTIAQNARDAW